MNLEDLAFRMVYDETDHKDFEIAVDSGFVLIGTRDMDEEATLHELALATSVGLIYMVSYLHGIIPDKQDVINTGYKFYHELVSENYKNLKGIKEMSLEEFNEYMKKYNRRDDG